MTEHVNLKKLLTANHRNIIKQNLDTQKGKIMYEYIVAAVLVLLTALYLRVKYKMSYWRNLGVPEDIGYFPLGSMNQWQMLSQKIAFSQLTDEVYKTFPTQKYVGSYRMFGEPTIIIRDIELAKRIMIKDFDHFVDRIAPGNELGDIHSKNNKYLAGMITQMSGEKWKHMRSTLSPIFTSGKLKNMVPLIHKVADECNKHLEKRCGEDINGKALMRDFSLDVIISTAFGIESNTFEEPDNMFHKYSKKLIGEELTWKFSFSVFLFFVCPRVVKWLDLPIFFDKNTGDFFANLVRTSMKERKESGVRRNDLVDLVIDVMEKEAYKEEDSNDAGQYDKDAELKDAKKEKQQYTQEELEVILISNALLTFLVGFDQVSNLSSKTLLYMANHQDIQDKLYKEIADMVKESGSDKLDYASVMKIPYLEQVLHESLRHYPLGHLERVATKDYKIPDSDVIIPKGMTVQISYSGIMKDKQFFEDPDVYNPDNFSEEAKSQRNPYAYAGFGHGPRNCIAMRFALLQVKLVICRVLTSFKIVPCEKTVKEMIPNPKSRSLEPKGGTWFSVEKRKH